MKIVSRSVERIKPSLPSPGAFLSLSCIDQVTPPIYTPVLFVFPGPCFHVGRLKQSLSTTLSIFYPLAGRYSRLPSKLLQLHCTDDGVDFHEVSMDGELEEFHGFDEHDPRYELLNPCSHSPVSDITQVPLVLVQVSRFKCGGSSLVVAVHHVVGDGLSMANFVTAWSQVCTGNGHLVQPPCFNSSLLRPTLPCRQFLHSEYQTMPPAAPSVFPRLKVCMFKFTKEKIDSLRATCNPGATRFEALTGHIWKSITVARSLEPEQVTKVGVAVDGRARLSPPLPEGYFGNPVFHACAASQVGELTKNPTSYAVKLVHEAVRRMTNEYMQSALEWLEKQETQGNVFPSFCNAETDMAMTSWSRLPLYEVEFECGKPLFVGVPLASFTGSVIFLPSQVESVMTVLLGLYSEHMSKLLATPGFLSCLNDV